MHFKLEAMSWVHTWVEFIREFKERDTLEIFIIEAESVPVILKLLVPPFKTTDFDPLSARAQLPVEKYL